MHMLLTQSLDWQILRINEVIIKDFLQTALNWATF